MKSCLVTKTLSVLSIAFALSHASAYAQSDGPKARETTVTTTTTVTRAWTEPASRWQKSSDLIGKDVQSGQGGTIGEVDDMIIDLDSGRVLYYVIGCDGKECVVPSVAMVLPAEAKQFTTPVTKDQLKAYAFETKNMPNFTDRTWTVQVHKHYNVRPVWEASLHGGTEARLTTDRLDGNVWYRFPLRTQRATNLMGMDVRNPQNENLGEIEDVVIDPDTGRVIYGVLSFGGFLGMGDKLFAIPWSTLKQTAGNEKEITLSIDKDRLKNASGFDKKQWPNMADQRWATDIHSFYGTEPYWVEPKDRP